MTNTTILQNMLDEAIILNQRAHEARWAALAKGDTKVADDKRAAVKYFAELIDTIEEIAEALGERISEDNAVIYR